MPEQRKQQVATTQPQQEVASFSKPRLPHHPEIEKRFGVDKGGWKVLVEAIFPAAQSADSVVMALSYCKSRGLDPFKRPIHIVPVWDNKRRAYVETIWPGIAELRTTAHRTGQYAGIEEIVYGDLVKQIFEGEVGSRDRKEHVRVEVGFPMWAQATVLRVIDGNRIGRFVGPKVFWLEACGRRGGSDVPNEMWAKRPMGQIGKVAEAAALRQAFPEESGGMATAEEMEGQVLLEGERMGPAVAGVITHEDPPAAPKPTQQQAAKQEAKQEIEDAEVVEKDDRAGAGGGAQELMEAEVAGEGEPAAEDDAAGAAPEGDALDWTPGKNPEATFKMIEGAYAALQPGPDADKAWADLWFEVEEHVGDMIPPDADAIRKVGKRHAKRLGLQAE